MISGANLPVNRSGKGLDPFVRVEIHGVPADSCRKNTPTVNNNCESSSSDLALSTGFWLLSLRQLFTLNVVPSLKQPDVWETTNEAVEWQEKQHILLSRGIILYSAINRKSKYLNILWHKKKYFLKGMNSQFHRNIFKKMQHQKCPILI